MPQDTYSKGKAVLREILEEASEEAGKEIGFVQRQSKMMEKEFVETLVLGWIEQPEASLMDLAQISRDLGVEITGSGIDQRIIAKGVKLLKEVIAVSGSRFPLQRA